MHSLLICFVFTFGFLFNAVGVSTEITKINDELLVAQKGDLFYVLERVNSAQDLLKWQQFAALQKSAREILYDELSGVTHLAGSPAAPDASSKVSKLLKFAATIKSGVTIFRDFSGRLAHHGDAEIWTSYISTVPVSAKFSLENIDTIEMVVAVSTNSEIPFQNHYGIFRCFAHMAKVIDGTAESHPGISVSLHAFAAKAMQQATPVRKVFMINLPYKEMREIIMRALEGVPRAYQILYNDAAVEVDEEFRVDNWVIDITHGEQPFNMKIRDWDGNTLYEHKSVDGRRPRNLGWFNHRASEHMPLFVVDIGVLAENF